MLKACAQRPMAGAAATHTKKYKFLLNTNKHLGNLPSVKSQRAAETSQIPHSRHGRVSQSCASYSRFEDLLKRFEFQFFLLFFSGRGDEIARVLG